MKCLENLNKKQTNLSTITNSKVLFKVMIELLTTKSSIKSSNSKIFISIKVFVCSRWKNMTKLYNAFKMPLIWIANIPRLFTIKVTLTFKKKSIKKLLKFTQSGRKFQTLSINFFKTKFKMSLSKNKKKMTKDFCKIFNNNLKIWKIKKLSLISLLSWLYSKLSLETLKKI